MSKGSDKKKFKSIIEDHWSVSPGQHFGNWIVVSEPYHNKASDQIAECRCKLCNFTYFVATYSLTSGKSNMCIKCARVKLPDYNRKGTKAHNGIKKCSKCKVEKSIDSFRNHPKTSDSLSSACKQCIRDGELKRIYGISFDEFKKLSELQHNKCSICGLEQSELKRELAIDHDHSTNIIRGLLCQNCNTGLGLFKDDIEILLGAIKYLKGTNENERTGKSISEERRNKKEVYSTMHEG